MIKLLLACFTIVLAFARDPQGAPNDKTVFGIGWEMSVDTSLRKSTKSLTLKSPLLGMIPENVITLGPDSPLLNSPISFDQKLRELLARARAFEDPKLMIYLASHGTKGGALLCDAHTGREQLLYHKQIIQVLQDALIQSELISKPIEVLILVDSCYSGIFIDSFNKEANSQLKSKKIQIVTSTSKKTENGSLDFQSRLRVVDKARTAFLQHGIDPCKGMSPWECFGMLIETLGSEYLGTGEDRITFWTNQPIVRFTLGLREKLILFLNAADKEQADLQSIRADLKNLFDQASEVELEKLVEIQQGAFAKIVQLELAKKRGALGEALDLYWLLPRESGLSLSDSSEKRWLESAANEIAKEVLKKSNLTLEQAKVVLDYLTRSVPLSLVNQEKLISLFQKFGISPELKDYFLNKSLLEEFLRIENKSPILQDQIFSSYQVAVSAHLKQLGFWPRLSMIKQMLGFATYNECSPACLSFINSLLAPPMEARLIEEIDSVIRYHSQFLESPKKELFLNWKSQLPTCDRLL